MPEREQFNPAAALVTKKCPNGHMVTIDRRRRSCPECRTPFKQPDKPIAVLHLYDREAVDLVLKTILDHKIKATFTNKA